MLVISLLLSLVITSSAELNPSNPRPDLPPEFTAALDYTAHDCAPSGNHLGDCSPRDCSVEDCTIPRNFRGLVPPGYRRELQTGLGTSGCNLINNLPSPCVCSPINGGQGMEIECTAQVSSWFTVGARVDIEPCAETPHVEFFFRCPVANTWISVKVVEYGYTWDIAILPGTLSIHVPYCCSAGAKLLTTLGGRPSATKLTFAFDICGSIKIPFVGDIEKCGGDLGIDGIPYQFWETPTINFGSVCFSPPPPPVYTSGTPPLSVRAAPPPPTSNTLWTIVSGQEYCQTSAGNCVTTGIGQAYGANEACTIKASVQLSATATDFSTEQGYDILRIGSTAYSGTIGPSNVPMGADYTMIWSSDSSVHGNGFTICGAACSNCLAVNGVCYTHTCDGYCQWTDCKPPPAPPVPPPAPPDVPIATGCICATSCIGNPTWSDDGFCDDGGPGSEYSGCQFGTDCIDCGIRCGGEPPSAPPTTPGATCSNACIGTPSFAHDGYCDDGGLGSEYNSCQMGTDCDDCGVRSDLTTLAAQPPSFPPLISSLTTTTTSGATPTTEPPLLPLASLTPSTTKSPVPPPAPPSPSPPPAKQTNTRFTVSLIAAGSVGDYTDTSGLQASFASTAGVSASDVAITVTAASVIITAEITASANIATTVSNAIANSFSSSSAASTALGITVVSTPLISQESVAESSSSDSNTGLIIGAATGGTVAVITLVGVVLIMKKKTTTVKKVGVAC